MRSREPSLSLTFVLKEQFSRFPVILKACPVASFEDKAEENGCTNPHMFLLNVEEIGSQLAISRESDSVQVRVSCLFANSSQSDTIQVALYSWFILFEVVIPPTKLEDFSFQLEKEHRYIWVHPGNIRHDQCLDLGVSAFFWAIGVTEVCDVL